MLTQPVQTRATIKLENALKAAPPDRRTGAGPGRLHQSRVVNSLSRSGSRKLVCPLFGTHGVYQIGDV